MDCPPSATRLASWGLFLAMSMGFAACGGYEAAFDNEAPSRKCIPGASVACACPSGKTGAQLCLQSGQGYGPCECADGGEGGDGDASIGDAGDDDLLDAGDDASDPSDGGDAGGDGDAGDVDPTHGPLASNLAITDVIAYQAVGIALMRDDAEVTQRNAPIIAGKDTLIRVLVAPTPGWQARLVVGRLELHDSNGPVAAYESKVVVMAASKEETLSSSFNFEIPGSLVTSDVSFNVSIHEANDKTHPGDATKSKWPSSGTSHLRAQSANGNLKITIVPYRYNGLVPDTSEEHLQVFRDKFTAYPTPGVEITVHPVVNHSGTFTSGGSGWNQLLNKTCNLRLSEGADRNEFYYGIIVPTSSVYDFCGQGCVAGLAPLAQQATDNTVRCGIGLGFKAGDLAAETALHEIGHALGREHAPCGLDGQRSDRNYPYTNAGLGVWGWEAPKRALRHPSNVKDMMSYCSPIWISDYTYQALFNRIAFVNASPMTKLPENFPERWRAIVIEADGSLVWGETMKLDSMPGGAETTVQLLDASGNRMGAAKGYFYEMDHLPGGWVVVPEEELAGAKAVRIEGKPALPL